MSSVGTSTLGKRSATAESANGSATEALNGPSVPSSSAKTATTLGSKRRKLSYPSLGGAPAKSAIKKLVYSPDTDNVLEGCEPNSVAKIFIALKFLEEFDQKASVWGTSVYTDDSDILAACIHDGALKLGDVEKRIPAPAGVVVTLKIDGSQRKYPGNIRNGIKSQTWVNYQGNSFSILKVRFVDPDPNQPARNTNNASGTVDSNSCPTNSTDSNNRAATNAISVRKRRIDERFKKLFLPNVTVVFNLSNEPCLKYSLNTVADKGFEDKTLTSYRLLTEVMFVETHNSRFELSLHEKYAFSNGTTTDNIKNNNSLASPDSANGCCYRYRWARVLSPHTLDITRLSGLELPLIDDQVEKINDELKWSEFQWSAQSVSVRGIEYQICRIQFCKRSHEIVVQSPTTHAIPNNAADSDPNRAPTPLDDSSAAAPTSSNAAIDSTTEDSDSNAPVLAPAPTRRAKKGRGGRISSADTSTRVASATASAGALASQTSSSDEMD